MVVLAGPAAAEVNDFMQRMEKLMALTYVEGLRAKRIELQDELAGYETGRLYIGNRWEGRTDAKMHDLRREIAEHDLLIERNEPRGPKGEKRPGDVIGAAGSSVKRIVNFRRKWANKSDRAINAALNHFWVWGKQINKSATAMPNTRRKPTIRPGR